MHLHCRQSLLFGLLLGCVACVVACGGGSDGGDGPAPVAPAVIAFSPTVAPYDMSTGVQAARFTNDTLTLETDPAYPGKIVIFFNAGATLDGDSFFIGRDRLLGLHPDALSQTHAIPGVGFVPLLVDVEILADRIILTPVDIYAPTLPPGQYTVRVGPEGLATNGRPVAPAPVFHTFFVDSDAMLPVIRATIPERDATGVSTTAPIIVHFTEGIAQASLDATTIHVEHLGALAVTTLLAAVGHPRMQMDDDGTTLPSNGHTVVWRAQDPFPTSGSIRVTVGNGSALGGNDVLDLNGNEPSGPYVFTFRVGP